MKIAISLALLVYVVFSGTVRAQGAGGAEPLPPRYVGLLGSFAIADHQRDVDVAYGGQFLFGIPLTPNVNLELNAAATLFDYKTAMSHGQGNGVGVDLVFTDDNDVGLMIITGAGTTVLDRRVSTRYSPYLNVGAGFLLRPEGARVQWRGEARLYSIFEDQLAVNRSILFESRFSFGLQYLLSQPAARKPQRAASPPPSTAALDADRDGIADAQDQCPGTPAGVAVDVAGCIPAPAAFTPAPAPLAPIPVAPPPVVDSDGDGVPEVYDQCSGTPVGTLVDARGCPPVQPRALPAPSVVVPAIPAPAQVPAVSPATVRSFRYSPAGAEIPASAARQLDELVAALLADQSLRLTITGHTDNVGAQADNLALSRTRALVVRNYFVSKGVSPRRLSADGEGSFRPIDRNDTEAGRANNRRVEVRVVR